MLDCPATIINSSNGAYYVLSCTDTVHTVIGDYQPRYIAKMEEDGDFVWRHFLDLDDFVAIFMIHEVSDGGVIAVGWWAEGGAGFSKGYLKKSIIRWRSYLGANYLFFH